MSYLKGVRSGAEGNRSLLKQYHGSPGSGPAARQHYATGGAVKGGNPSLNEGLSAASGAPAKPSLARPGRKMPGKGKSAKGGKTNVNVIIASPPAKEAGAMPPALGAGPPPMPPPGAGPGGPPMPPMRASGGRIANLGKYAHGGKVTTKGDEAGKIAKKETHGAEPYKEGGPVMGLSNKQGGAGGASGRLAKVRMYGK